MQHMRAVVRGGGSIGARHLDVLQQLGMTATLWPVRPRPSGEVGHLRGGDAEGLALYADADLVVIATDTSRHVDDVLLALEHGARRVLVEKPVATTAHDAAALAAHPRAAAVAVAAPLRAHESFHGLAEEIARLPTPVQASIRCRSWLPDWRPGTDYRRSYSARADEGGVLRDLVHELDYALHLFGAARLAGAVLDGGPLEIEAEQAASLLWSTDTATVSVRLDYVTRPASRGASVSSASGSVEWDVLTSSVTGVDADGRRTTTTYERDRERNVVMARQIRAFLEAESLDGNEGSAWAAPATLADGIAAVALCDAARHGDSLRPRGELSHD